jgi:hypothetical protein
MGDANGVVVDPNALNTFAQGLAGTTSALAQRAASEVPALDAEISKGASMLTEGQSFHAHLSNTALQFTMFLLDATAGIGALSDGADVISLNYSNTDLANAAALYNADPGHDPFSAQSILQLISVGGSSAQFNATQQNVDDVFNPSASLANPTLAMFHSQAVSAPPPPAPTGGPRPAAPGRSAIDEARDLAAGPSSVPGESDLAGAATTYHTAHPVEPLKEGTMPPLIIPGDAIGQDGVTRSGQVQGGTYDGQSGAELEKDLAQILDPLGSN